MSRYQRQNNWINASSLHLYSELYPYSDGRDSSTPPFYQINIEGKTRGTNCPMYNYTLPDTYPQIPIPTINPKYYWYYPYQTYDWNHPNLEIKKPS